MRMSAVAAACFLPSRASRRKRGNAIASCPPLQHHQALSSHRWSRCLHANCLPVLFRRLRLTGFSDNGGTGRAMCALRRRMGACPGGRGRTEPVRATDREAAAVGFRCRERIQGVPGPRWRLRWRQILRLRGTVATVVCDGSAGRAPGPAAVTPPVAPGLAGEPGIARLPRLGRLCVARAGRRGLATERPGLRGIRRAAGPRSDAMTSYDGAAVPALCRACD